MTANRDSNLQVDVEMVIQKGMDSRVEPELNLQITDRKSGMPIVQVKLTAGEVLAALSGSYLGDVPGWFTPVPERIGKKMVHRSIVVPREVTDGIPYSRTSANDERERAVRAWGAERAADDETVEPRNSNSGWTVIFRRYIEEES